MLRHKQNFGNGGNTLGPLTSMADKVEDLVYTKI